MGRRGGGEGPYTGGLATPARAPWRRARDRWDSVIPSRDAGSARAAPECLPDRRLAGKNASRASLVRARWQQPVLDSFDHGGLMSTAHPASHQSDGEPLDERDATTRLGACSPEAFGQRRARTAPSHRTSPAAFEAFIPFEEKPGTAWLARVGLARGALHNLDPSLDDMSSTGFEMTVETIEIQYTGSKNPSCQFYVAKITPPRPAPSSSSESPSPPRCTRSNSARPRDRRRPAPWSPSPAATP
jgi:hypothetical protein